MAKLFTNARVSGSPQVARLLADAPTLGHDHHWEGALTGSSGAAEGCHIKLKATIAFAGALVEGKGRFSNVAAAITDAQATLSISGTLEADRICLRLWSASAELGRVPFETTGQLESDGRVMRGQWSVACFDPDSCGCAGGTGVFHLRRVD